VMSVFIDRKFVGLIQFRLEQFVQKSPDLYNFRCPYCHDSKKRKTKKRGYIYRKGNDYFFRCHNCGEGTTFGNFLKFVDPGSYKQYVLEKYSEGNNAHSPVEKPNFDELKGNVFEHFAKEEKKLSVTPVNELPESHFARDYIENRGIPEQFWNEIYFTENFKEFMDADFPEHGKDDLPEDARIVLFFTDENENIQLVSGRALADTKMRYISVTVTEHDRKLFGTHRLDPTKACYVVEGQFDSLFIDNCVATGDSSLASVLDVFPNADWTMIYDNEPRNKDIVRQIEKTIDKGCKVVIFPEDLPEKDINDMVLAGRDIKKLIQENTVQGIPAMLKFIKWKRV
jgi:transcription elongation factor Elf1